MARGVGFFPLIIGAFAFAIAPVLIKAQLRVGSEPEGGAGYSWLLTIYRWLAGAAMVAGLLILLLGS